MGQRLADFRALGRCWRLAAGLPSAVAFGWRMLSALTRAYDDIVAPIVARSISDLGERARVNPALRAMSAKIGMIMLVYARMAGCEQQQEVAALAGAIARLYDDLIDGRPDESRDNWLGDLFNGKISAAHSDLEYLLAELASEIRRRILPLAHDPVVAAFNALHEYQCLSRQQREEAVPLTVLEKICQGKGALASLTVCRLVKPGMGTGEQELVMALGEMFQSLDDYADAGDDQRNGVATLAVLGETTLAAIGSVMRVLRSRLITRYGRAAARPYCGMMFFLLAQTAMSRRLAVIGRMTGRLAGRHAALAFLVRGPNAVPAAPRLLQEDG
jgi:hypothetical protein